MLGSRKDDNLMSGRKVVWSIPSQGVALLDVLSALQTLAALRESEAENLMIGYWEYGDQIVVTALESNTP